MPALEKGQHGPLNVTKQARHRIFAGLGWDPKEKASLMEKAKALVGGPKTWHDLDLSCYMYDSNKALVDSVTAKADKHIDQTGNIYHSGDNVAGLGEGDDEQISVELIHLPENIHHIVFTVTIKTGHTFSDINSPEIRLADGYSGHEFLSLPLSVPEGRDKSGFIFAHIYRSEDSDGWALHNISQFLDADDMQKWPVLMTLHLGDKEE